MELCVSRSHVSKAAHHLASYLQTDHHIVVSSLPVFKHEPPFIANCSGVVAQGIDVFPLLARNNQLLVSTEALEFVASCEHMSVEAANTLLEPWVFALGSTHLTVGDLAFADVLRNLLEKMAQADRARLPHVVRYVDHILHLPRCPIAPLDLKINELASGKKKQKEVKPTKATRPLDDVTRLDFRVGTITKVWEHPDSEKLWCEEIDCGAELGVRQISSGLRHFCTKDDMDGAKVIVLANLKARKLGGFLSHGMVMCASGGDPPRIELLRAPAAVENGERVVFDGIEMNEADEVLASKAGKNPWEFCAPRLVTDDIFQATMEGKVWMTSKGPVVCRTIAKGSIS